MNSGFLNIWKPAGLTSSQAVGRVRRILGIRQIGHAGTLDPDAVGVLPMAVGSATRLLPYVPGEPKIYEAWVEVGTSTHTGDAAGRVTARSQGWELPGGAVEEAARWLSGSVWQIPPQVSALKIGGVRQYQAVRENQTVWPAPRRVRIEPLEAIEVVEGGWRFRAEVGSGTYIRALVRDWAEILGVAAHLKKLARIQVGRWTEAGAATLEDLESGWERHLQSWDTVLDGVPRYPLTAPEFDRVQNGDVRVLEKLPEDRLGILALTVEGRLAAIVEGPPYRYRLVFKEGT